ncbi:MULTISPECIES: hypothetical protein [unclassified Paracoccus (in: a-proteobacteria)]|uniref:hypothetical protein n=1 Tax=unclassified Paracoccus (in: a-proteobacteria) TaxID=2688777 RepID=UPI0012B1A67B|nr:MULTISPECIES: hypothetical protein [unclassified Paracoccus (in: a-proteobacteria)]UXU75796.1 hypothetical protein GB879_004745 [Paracoccus sp. SMMA_5]UXU81705.1 hypothetical protein GB880_004735 [Paracoccus sp. SMMA_5_TC]
MTQSDIASLWIGDRLGDIELASIASFLRQGHDFTLYSYGPVANVPEGVRLEDARQILPGDQILRYWRNGNPALHADVFRYAMIARTGAIWVDLDVIALRPFRFPGPWVFGYEDAEQVNNAVLGLPADSPMLARLLEMRPDTRGVPPHLTGARRLKYRLRGWLTGGVPISRWPWASTGPRAVTLFARQSGEIRHALPPTAFYAIPHHAARSLLVPGGLSAGMLPEDAYGVHLWGGELRRILTDEFDGRVPATSFLGQQLAMAR